MLLAGTTLAIPMSLLAAFAPSDTVLFLARVGGGLAAGMAYPTTLALITALWVGVAADEVDRAVVGHRRRDRRARAASLRAAARALLVGIGVPDHAPARGRRDRDGLAPRPRARERDDRAGGQPRRDPLRRARRGAHPLDQLRARAEQGHADDRPRADRGCGARRLLPPTASRRESAVRPRGREPAARSGSRPAPGSSSSAR